MIHNGGFFPDFLQHPELESAESVSAESVTVSHHITSSGMMYFSFY